MRRVQSRLRQHIGISLGIIFFVVTALWVIGSAETVFAFRQSASPTITPYSIPTATLTPISIPTATPTNIPTESPAVVEPATPPPPTATPEPILPTATPIPSAAAPQTPVSPAVTPPIRSGEIYTVQRGDSLFSIATKLGVTMIDLARVNNIINYDHIEAGQQLNIPGAGSATTTTENEAAATESDDPPATQPEASVPETSPIGAYVVRSGDTLFKIARQHGLTLGQLAALNNISNPDHIFVGQILIISGTPTEDAPAPSNPAPSTLTHHYVVVGDTLSIIAARYNISMSNLATANNITNFNHIYVGQKLIIPAP